MVIDGLHVKDELHDADYAGIPLLGNITPENVDAAYDARVKYPYLVTEEIEITRFSSASGLKWKLTDNPYMYRDTRVAE